jgi:hypothetical protein
MPWIYFDVNSAELRVESLVPTTFRFSPVRYRALWLEHLSLASLSSLAYLLVSPGVVSQDFIFVITYK